MVFTITDKNEVKKSLVEVQSIIGKLSQEEYTKIPDNIKLYIEYNKDNNYVWNYDERKTLEEQNLNEYTLPILAYINTEFLLNKEQKEFMNFIYDRNDRILENKFKKRYNSDNIFKKRYKI